MFQRRTFTPVELLVADAAKVIPMPDLEARRRMTRRERLQGPSGRRPRWFRCVCPRLSTSRRRVNAPTSPSGAAPGAEPQLDPRAELAAEIGAECDRG